MNIFLILSITFLVLGIVLFLVSVITFDETVISTSDKLKDKNKSKNYKSNVCLTLGLLSLLLCMIATIVYIAPIAYIISILVLGA